MCRGLDALGCPGHGRISIGARLWWGDGWLMGPFAESSSTPQHPRRGGWGRSGGGGWGVENSYVCFGIFDFSLKFPSHVASGRCFLPAAAAGAPAGVVSAFTEPSSWCVGAVLNVAWCAVCASAAPNGWRKLRMCWLLPGRLTVFAVHVPLSTGRP